MHYKSLDPIKAIEDLKIKYPYYDFSKAVYTKSCNKIKVICPYHGEFEIIYNNLSSKRNRGCSKCNGGVKYTQEDALNKLKSIFPNYIFDKFVYNGPHKQVTITCPEHGDFTKVYSYLSSGFGCTHCRDFNKIKTRTTNITRVKEHIKMLEQEYPTLDFSKFNVTNKRDKSIVICKDHGEFYTNIENTRKATHICPYCSGMRNYKPIEDLNRINDKFDLSKFIYKTSKSKSIIICPEHGEFKESYFNIIILNKGKIYCPYCSSSVSSNKENDIYENILNKFKNIKIEQHNRNIVLNEYTNKYLELDIYLPDISLAIEFNGTYWHSDEVIKNRSKFFNTADEYHEYKLIKCKEKGIKLIHISEKEYDNNRDKILNKIYRLINHQVKNLVKVKPSELLETP